MAEPAADRGRGVPRRRGGPLEQPVVDAQRQPLAGLAGGAVAEGAAAERDDVLAGGVAVEDLEEEQGDGGDRVEEPLAPGVALLAAGVLDGRGSQEVGLVLSEAVE